MCKYLAITCTLLAWLNPLPRSPVSEQQNREDDPKVECTGTVKRLSTWLAELEGSPEPEKLDSVLLAIEKNKPAQRRAAATLGKFLGNQRVELRRQVAGHLRHLGEEALPASRALLDAIGDPDSGVSHYALGWFEHLSDENKLGAVPTLRKGLQHQLPTARVRYACALWFAQHEAQEVMPVFMSELANINNPEETRTIAGRWLFDIVPPRSRDVDIAALKALLNDSNELVRMEAAAVVWRIEGDRDSVLPTLTAGLKSKRPEVRERAAFVICGYLGKYGHRALPELEDAIEAEKDAPIKRRMIRHILSLGQDAMGDAAPKLAKIAAEDPDDSIAGAAVGILSQLDSPQKELVAALVPALKRKHLQETLGRLFARIGADAKEAFPELLKIAQEPTDTGERRAARYAVRKIDPEAAKNAGIK